jgi:hypothetical protein
VADAIRHWQSFERSDHYKEMCEALKRDLKSSTEQFQTMPPRQLLFPENKAQERDIRRSAGVIAKLTLMTIFYGNPSVGESIEDVCNLNPCALRLPYRLMRFFNLVRSGLKLNASQTIDFAYNYEARGAELMRRIRSFLECGSKPLRFAAGPDNGLLQISWLLFCMYFNQIGSAALLSNLFFIVN